MSFPTGKSLSREVRLTPEELAQFDGSDPTKPIYLAISGIIYDVSAGPQFYGKDGSYNHFSGRDASRSYITGCQDDHLTHDLRGLSEAQIKSLEVWEQFYQTSNKYFKVGEVIHKPIDPNSPIPKDCGQ
ncbi:cytochrome b5-like heme/steroid binding domain-containing protein [Phlyctochytrium arcticum]|nr:cytochrome b5-like heme/steroid binding domain-containing protein [Phlyctochytrium arcticum]